MLVKAFELKWSPFPRGKQIQHLNAKTAVTVIFKQYHITLKCNSPLNSREIQCPVNASSLHHSTIKCHKYVGATEAYRRNALSNTGSFLQARDKVEKERSSSLMKESRRRSNLFRCAGQAKVGKWGTQRGLGSWLWAELWPCLEPLLLSTGMCFRVPHTTVCWHIWLCCSTGTLSFTPLGSGRNPSYSFGLQLLVCYLLLFLLW